jgi:uncharacterized protein
VASAFREKGFRIAAWAAVGCVVGCLYGIVGGPTGVVNPWAVLAGGALGLLAGGLLGGLGGRPEAPAPAVGRRCQRCQAAATLHITEARGRSAVGEVHLCEQDARRYLFVEPTPAPAAGWHLPDKPSEGILAAPAVTGVSATAGPGYAAGEVEVEVARVIISEVHEQQVVFLREVGGGRTFPVVMGIAEAVGIERRVKGLPSTLPLAHDSWASTITALGGRLREVCAHDLRDHTYFAQARVVQGDRVAVVEVRPSDTLTLALAGGVPILAADRFLAGASRDG